VNNLAFLASLTLQKVLNINNINNNNNHIHNNNNNNKNGTRSDSATSYQQLSAVAKATTAALKLQQQQQQQQQRRHSDNEAENDVLNQLLKTGAVFTTTTSGVAAAIAVTPTSVHSAPITIEKKPQQHQHQKQQQQLQQQNGNSAQKQRLNSSISSTNSSTSSNSLTANSYGSSCSSSEEPMTALTTSTSTTKSTAGVGFIRTNTNNNNNNHNNKSSSIKLPEKSKIPSDILDDLASRFIINVPDMELNNLIRICFQIELAHWFYLDFFCAPAPDADQTPQQQQQQQLQLQRKLPIVGIKQFAMQVFQHIPFLNKHFGTVDQILEDWKNYKLSVPTYGAILVSEDLNHCLLVQSYFARNSWGFPKGKINENENPAHCATREASCINKSNYSRIITISIVYEETGFDITKIIDADDYIEALINYQYTRLYIVRNIPLDTQFAPRTRNEIKCCDWFRIDALPVNKNDAISKAKLGKNSNSFFMIMPFVKRLKKWVNDRRNGIEPATTRRNKSSGQHSPRGILGAPNSASPTIVTNSNGNGNKKELTSRRQRHKSMGDLDGVKLNNLNGKPGAGCNSNGNSNICNSNIKRNSNSNTNKQLNVAAGSNIIATATTAAVPATGTISATAAAAAAGTTAAGSKRQLFHSQSQNDAQQPASNEKVSNGKPMQNAENAKPKQLQIVSSFDLIRKEKQQQLKAAKAQKQQQQQQRSRTKSQSDKQSNQQQPMVVKSILTKNNTQQQPQPQQQQSTPTTGIDLIAMLTAAAAAQKTPNPEQQQQRPRPASVSLNSPIAATAAASPDAQTLHKLQRMASGTNLRILKRAQSQQPLAQQQHLQLQQQQQQQQQLQSQQPLLQQQQQQQGPLHFTPNFNSWTNFSFTKNFIANVFC
ncbi:hypothetical protein KR044_005633, partial [Drosophila immigrans]